MRASRTLALGGFAVCCACSPAAGNTPPIMSLRNGDDFVPGIVTIAAGDRIVWSNEDRIPHTVQIDGTSTSLTILPGDIRARTFPTPGDYVVRDPQHPQMLATVRVEQRGEG